MWSESIHVHGWFGPNCYFLTHHLWHTPPPLEGTNTNRPMARQRSPPNSSGPVQPAPVERGEGILYDKMQKSDFDHCTLWWPHGPNLSNLLLQPSHQHFPHLSTTGTTSAAGWWISKGSKIIHKPDRKSVKNRKHLGTKNPKLYRPPGWIGQASPGSLHLVAAVGTPSNPHDDLMKARVGVTMDMKWNLLAIMSLW